MKLLNSVTLLFLTVFFITTGCKKDSKKADSGTYKCASCTTTPEAKTANDASSKGIYKGIVIGSTGAIKFDVQNGGTLIKAYLTIDGINAELTSNVAWQGPESYLAPFTGLLNGQAITIHFSVGMGGSSPIVTSSSIPGHPNAQFVLVKETSAALIECYEGTYHTSKPEDGTFNIILSRSLNKWSGIARENGKIETDDINGKIVNNKLIEDNGTTIGTLANDEINGSFNDDNGKTVTIKGKRTL
jgi:hypothetical protein